MQYSLFTANIHNVCTYLYTIHTTYPTQRAVIVWRCVILSQYSALKCIQGWFLVCVHRGVNAESFWMGMGFMTTWPDHFSLYASLHLLGIYIVDRIPASFSYSSSASSGTSLSSFFPLAKAMLYIRIIIYGWMWARDFARRRQNIVVLRWWPFSRFTNRWQRALSLRYLFGSLMEWEATFSWLIFLPFRPRTEDAMGFSCQCGLPLGGWWWVCIYEGCFACVCVCLAWPTWH